VSTVSDCDVCREVNGEIELPGGFLIEAESVLAFHVPPLLEPRPQLGHLLVVPRRHADTWADLTEHEAAAIGEAAAALGRALRGVTRAERLYSAVIGHHSAHFHLHLFPRYPGTPAELGWTECDEWPGCPRGGAQEIAAYAEQLRAARRLPFPVQPRTANKSSRRR
jgi:diadenosine tetraphosphate (Ap4A) HIT family hydrolase